MDKSCTIAFCVSISNLSYYYFTEAVKNPVSMESGTF